MAGSNDRGEAAAQTVNRFNTQRIEPRQTLAGLCLSRGGKVSSFSFRDSSLDRCGWLLEPALLVYPMLT